MDDVAHPLPAILIAEYGSASRAAICSSAGRPTCSVSKDRKDAVRHRHGVAASLTELFDYMTSLVEQRRREPKDDLITALALAEKTVPA